MSLHYILDGYNILKQVTHLVEKRIKEGRLSFIKMIETSPRFKKQRITIIFDGYEDAQGLGLRDNFQVLFSKGVSADEKIKAFVERSKQASEIVVVSDDKEIRFYVRMLGAQILGVCDFLSLLSEKKDDNRKFASGLQDEDKRLSYKEELEINRELRKRWLKEP